MHTRPEQVKYLWFWWSVVTDGKRVETDMNI